ncbi:DNA-binding response regulator [Candidatus Nitrotoga sp. BS]|nr:DNA-binding response regulator [Candidatus Nitrotoga sp. BS]
MSLSNVVQPISVLLIDDHPVVRDGFRRLLESTADIRVVAEADDGEAGYILYRAIKPDVVVLDLNMPGSGGLETIRRIRAHDPVAHILVFSMHNNETMVQRVLEMGATGYLTKKSGLNQMTHAVRQVKLGKTYIDLEHISDIVVDRQLFHEALDPINALSKREFQLFKLMAEGNSILEIAENLSISPKLLVFITPAS